MDVKLHKFEFYLFIERLSVAPQQRELITHRIESRSPNSRHFRSITI